MHTLTPADRQFRQEFETGALPPSDFNHREHLRLAYVHLVEHGVEPAISTFRSSLLAYLQHHQVDRGKYHETLTQAWLRAVWHFMQRAGNTAGSDDFLERSGVLLDSKVMLTHYSREVLFGDDARRAYVEPDLEPIPEGADPGNHRVV